MIGGAKEPQNQKSQGSLEKMGLGGIRQRLHFFEVGNFNHPKLGTMLMVGLASRGYTKTMEGGDVNDSISSRKWMFGCFTLNPGTLDIRQQSVWFITLLHHLLVSSLPEKANHFLHTIYSLGMLPRCNTTRIALRGWCFIKVRKCDPPESFD